MTILRYFPRAVVGLSGSVQGETFTFVVYPRAVSVTRRSHNQAGSCEVTVDGSALPFDPRDLDDVFISVWIGTVARMGDDVREVPGALRFVGYADDSESEDRDESEIKLSARDLSALLREAKPIPAEYVPHYGMTLGDAIASLVRTSGTAARDLTVRDNAAAGTPLGPTVAGRHANRPIHLDPNWSAWEAIEHCCSLAGKLVGVRFNEIVVREPTDAYGHTNAPRHTFVFGVPGANVGSVRKKKRFVRNRKGIRVAAWDPATRRLVTADYPPDAELRRLRLDRPNQPAASAPASGARRQGTARTSPPSGRTALERDVFTFSGVTDPRALASVAEALWRERSSQEIELSVEAATLEPELLALENGDRVRMDLSPLIASGMADVPRTHRAAFVARRLGVTRDAADLLLRAAAAPKTNLFYVREANIAWSDAGEDGDGEALTVKAELINLVDLRSQSRPASDEAIQGQVIQDLEREGL